MELVPIKVRIGLRSNKGKLEHDHPEFNKLPEELRDGLDWSHYVDKFGGWLYDRVSGHPTHDPDNDSPQGIWLGMLLVPEEFANAAIDEFPDQVSQMSEPECVEFYENRCTVNRPEIQDDVEVLQAIAAKRAAGVDVDDDDVHALDPDHPARGRRRNKTKTFAGYKQKRNITIKK